MRKLKYLALLAIACLITSSCVISIDSCSSDIKKEDLEPISKEESLSDFNVIDAVSADVIYVIGDENKIEYTVSKSLLDRITIKSKNGKLLVKAEKRSGREIFKCVVTGKMPIESFDVSGASKFMCKSDMIVDDVEIDCSGASDFAFDGKLTVKELDVDSSGASNVSVNDFIGIDLSVESSGASDVSIKGIANVAKLEASGASNIQCGKLIASSVIAEASGASDIVVASKDDVKKSSSGASSIKIIRLSE